MADPWTDDLAAHGERTRAHMRSIAATRAAVLSRKENSMSFIKRRPILAALVGALVLAIAAPVAWAIGEQIFVTIDAGQSAPEIEQSITDQLAAIGVKAHVEVDKPGDHAVRVRITSDDPAMLRDGVAVQIAGSDAAGAEQRTQQLRIAVRVDGDLDDAQKAALTRAVADGRESDEDREPAAIAQAIRDGLAAAGFRDAEVNVDGDSIDVHVKAAPTPAK